MIHPNITLIRTSVQVIYPNITVIHTTVQVIPPNVTLIYTTVQVWEWFTQPQALFSSMFQRFTPVYMWLTWMFQWFTPWCKQFTQSLIHSTISTITRRFQVFKSGWNVFHPNLTVIQSLSLPRCVAVQNQGGEDTSSGSTLPLYDPASHRPAQ